MRIKEILKERSMTVSDLAEKMGRSQEQLSRIINGNPTLSTLQKIADVLDISVSEIFDDPKSNILICPNCQARLHVRVGEGNDCTKFVAEAE